MQNLEENEILEACSRCFREHNNRCVAEGLNCEIGLTHSLEDYKTEYVLYNKAVETREFKVINGRVYKNDKKIE